MYNRFTFHLTWLIIATILTGSAVTVHGDDFVELRNDHAAYRFDAGSGFGLAEVVHFDTDRKLVDHEGTDAEPTLWRVKLYFPAEESHQMVDNRAGGRSSHTIEQDEDGQRLTLNWRGVPVDDGKASIDVQVTVHLPEDDSLARWHMTVQTQGPCHVWTTDFPLVQGIQDLGDDYLVLPYDWGRIMRDPATRLDDTELQYPGALSMQFVAAWGSQEMAEAAKRLSPDPHSAQGWMRGEADDEAGLYLATEDSEMWYKAVHMHRQDDATSYGWHFEHYPALPEWPLSRARRVSEYTVPYPVVFGPYAGGVESAVKRYRQWALNQTWASRGPIWNPAPDAAYPVSPAIMDTALWARFAHTPPKVVREVSSYRSALRVPTSLHWYQYTISQFDDNFPEYLPADPYFPQAVRELQRMGVSVMPYINGLIWDTDTQSYKRENPSQGAARDPEGQTYDWLLKGNNIHVRMNPTYRPWQDKLVEVSDKLVGSYGVDGLYLDVLARNRWLDYFPDNHLPHGGTYWAEGNRTILDRMQQHVRTAMPHAYLTSEGSGEVYIDKTDAFLLLDIERYGWARGDNWDNYPIYTMVYHDYTALFGGDAQPLVNPQRTIWQLGLGMTWGAQAMYAGRDVSPIDCSERSRINGEYLRQVVQSYHQVGRKFLLGGLWVPTALVPDVELGGHHPVVIQSATHRVPMLRKGGADPLDWVGPAVLGSSWLAHDDTIGVVLTNISSEPQEVTLRIDVDALDMRAETLWDIWPLPVAKVTSLGDSVYETRFEIPAHSVRMFQAGGTEPEPQPLDEIDWQFVEADDEGRFPNTTVRDHRLWASHGTAVQSELNGEQQTLTLIESIASEPKVRTIETIVDWRNAPEGDGLPRAPADKPYFILEQTPYAIHGDAEVSTQVSFAHRVLYAVVESEEQFELEGPAGAILLARNDSGEMVATHHRHKFEAGRHHVAAVQVERLSDLEFEATAALLESLAAVGEASGDLIAAVANYSQQVETLLNEAASQTLSVSQKRLVAEAVEAASALVRATTGVTTSLILEEDWLAPSLPLPVTLELTGNGSDLVNINAVQWLMLDPHLADEVTIRPLETANGAPLERNGDTKLAYQLETYGFDAIERLLPLVAVMELTYDGRSLMAFAQGHVNVDYPVMIKCEDLTVSADEDGRAKGRISVKNVSPHAIEARMTVDLPRGWRASPQTPKPLSLAPYENTVIAFEIEPATRDRGVDREISIHLQYAGDKRTHIYDSFKVQARE